MEEIDGVYQKLQQHLDRHTLGFPKTPTGVEIRILKSIFTLEEAEISTLLRSCYETIESIYPRVGSRSISRDELEIILDGIARKGGIGYTVSGGKKYYKNIPLIVGMYEGQLNRLSPEFLSDVSEYTSGRRWGISFLRSRVSQMRTIPVEQSLTPKHYVATYDEISSIIEKTEEPVVVLECICRKTASLRGNSCIKTERKETCIALRNAAEACMLRGDGRVIEKEEALEITRMNEEEGLVLQPSNAQYPEFVCACCGCCCGMLRMQKRLPKPVDFWTTSYHALVNEELCTGCGTCIERCQVDAVTLESDEKAHINTSRCIGCGLCVTTCKAGALELEKIKNTTPPPQTDDEMWRIIMTNKRDTC